MSYFPYHQGNTMNDSQDSEPLLDDAAYQELREDPLLARIDSNNFASLLEAPSSNVEVRESRELDLEQLHQQLHPPPPQQDALNIRLDDQSLNNAYIMDDGTILALPDYGISMEDSWNNIEDTIVGNESLESHLAAKPEVAPTLPDSNGNNSLVPDVVPDSSPNTQVPSIQTWPGQYDFKITVPVGNKDRNKWCFSQVQNKLYLSKHVTVPIDVKLLQWLDGFITITPVFTSSRHRVNHVVPCYNCSSNGVSSDHIVMVEGQECEYTYKYMDRRPVVTLPLHPPPPGEAASTLLLKLICLTSCNGGPNRRPFSLVFTLHNSSGSEIGRQVLDMKCCQCPSRDMLNEDKGVQKNRHLTQPDSNQVRKRSGAPVPLTGEKKKRFLIKSEPGTDRRYTMVKVPVEYENKVKEYVDGLIAADFLRRNQSSVLLYGKNDSLSDSG